MKRLIKALLRKFWQATAFMRRPLARKLDSWMERLLDRVLERALSRQLEGPRASLDRVESALARAEGSALARTEGLGRTTQDLAQLSRQVEGSREMSEHALGETGLLLDCLLREVSRLQIQMEELHEQLAQSGLEESSLNLLENEEESTEAA